MIKTGTVSAPPLTLREAPPESPDIAAEFVGIAVPWETISDVGGLRERFTRGAIAPAAVVGLPLLWRHAEPVGTVTGAEDTPAGLQISGVILPTTAGRDAAILVRGQSVTGLSIGFAYSAETSSYDAGDNLLTHSRADVREISLTPLPAHADARLTAIREDQSMTATPTAPAPAPVPTEDLATREDLAALESRLLAGSPTDAPLLSERELFTAYRDGLRGSTEAIELVRRALADVTLTAAPGLSPTPYLSRIRGALTRGRPTAEAFGIEALPGYGMTVDIPFIATDPITGNQAAEKAEPASGPFVVSYLNAPVFTEAGANDVSRQFIERSEPAGLPLLMARFTEIYARRYNARVIAVANTATQSVTLASYSTADVGAALGEAAALVTAGVLTAPTFATVAPDLYFGIAMSSGNGFPFAGDTVGSADLTSLRTSVAGLTVICDPGLAAGTGFVSVSNGEALTVLESAGAPFTLEADVPSKLGRDVAVYGYGAIGAVQLAGIVKLAAPVVGP